MFKLFFSACTLAILAGCASTGTQISQEAALQFKEGVSTETDILSKLGRPTSVTINGDIKLISYTGSQYQTKAASFIPVVGMFAGGSDMQVTHAAYQIGPDGILKKIIYSTSGTGARMGATPTDMKTTEPTAIK